jgi:thiamine kinase-like enzyme
MNLKSVVKNTAFMFERVESKGEDFEIIDEIIRHCELGESSSIKFIASNYNYDVYKAVINGYSYCIKYSLDVGYKGFEHEHDTLSSGKLAMQPQAFAHGIVKFGDEISYSVTSFENAETIYEGGRATVIENLETFMKCYFSLHNNNLPRTTLKTYLSNVFSECSVESLSEDIIELFQKDESFSTIKSIIEEIKTDLSSYYKIGVVDKKQFCHGNINSENILFRNDIFKFVNFTQSFCGNSYFDFAAIVIEFNLNETLEKEFFLEFIKNQNLEYSKVLWGEYKNCFNILIRVKMLKLLFDLIQETYEFEGSRPSKIFNIVNLFALNSESFTKIPAIQKHYSFIHDIIFKSLAKDEDEDQTEN